MKERILRSSTKLRDDEILHLVSYLYFKVSPRNPTEFIEAKIEKELNRQSINFATKSDIANYHPNFVSSRTKEPQICTWCG